MWSHGVLLQVGAGVASERNEEESAQNKNKKVNLTVRGATRSVRDDVNDRGWNQCAVVSRQPRGHVAECLGQGTGAAKTSPTSRTVGIVGYQKFFKALRDISIRRDKERIDKQELVAA